MTTRNWTTIKEYEDIKFEFFEGIAKITINRPEVYNAFRPQTNFDMLLFLQELAIKHFVLVEIRMLKVLVVISMIMECLV